MTRRFHRCRRAGLRFVLAAALVLCPLVSTAAVGVPRKIDFAETANVRPQVRAQCDLQALIPAAIADSSPDAQLVDSGGDLSLEISGVHAPGGWIFSGAKWVEVTGSLRQGGKTYGFRAKRFSAFDPFAGGTCGILGKIARALGSDIAIWIANPTDDAEIGDVR